MVMRKNVMQKILRQSILRSLGRYIAIVAIIALGAGIFVGLRTTKSDMVLTGQKFTDQQNMFDFRLLNAYGWTQSDVDAVSKMDGVADAEGVISMDVIAHMGGTDEDSVFKLYTIPEKVNKVYLLGGRMPSAPNECLADGFHVTDAILGQTVTISQANDDATLDAITEHVFTVVGYVSTPLYMDMSRGNTSIGNGTVTSYIYVPRESANVDYYTEINITIPGDHTIYSKEYNAVLDAGEERFKTLLQPLAQQRLNTVKKKATEVYEEGLAEYEKGLAEYQEAEAETWQKLDDAKVKLEDGEKELQTRQELLESTKKTLDESQQELDKNRQTLAQTEADTYKQLADTNSQLLENYKSVRVALSEVNNGIAQIDSGIAQIDAGITQLQSGISQAETLLGVLDSTLPIMDRAVEQAQRALDFAQQQGAPESELVPLREVLAQAVAARDDYAKQRAELADSIASYKAQLADLQTQRAALAKQREELIATRNTLEKALAEIETGFLELQAGQTKAQNEFAIAKTQLDMAQAQINAGYKQIEEGTKLLDASRKDLDAAREEYKKGYATALKELGDAKQKLSDAKAELDDAKKQIEAMDVAEVFVLDRNTNVGYVALENNSDIVEGVSAVFPAFFLLIAALVCITTMTRMVEEERVQIGTLKALGYSNNQIISKYLAYAGSAALLGCGLGVIAGSIVFPLILWNAYGIIMLLTPSLVLQLDTALCLVVVIIYTAVTLFVTWYCCRMVLREVPAELIRPKPPVTGKKIFLEHLPFWDKFSFLNKVMLRNIFRYRQRLLMMLVGIGGCTALLLTGFGIRDSIVDIASQQFNEITLYDMDVRFSESQSQTQQENFLKENEEFILDSLFYHQSSMQIEYGDITKDVTFLAADEQIANMMNFHSGDESLPIPAEGEALISVGLAEMLDVKLGDTVIVRNSDMQSLTLTVSGIYDNYVYHYVITTPETVKDQWGTYPQMQMAALTVKDGKDVHEAAAAFSGADNVMSVTVNQDIAEQVGGMLDALDLIVVTVVICAGLLAVIVLYNLTNINITERIREIATIKVLGFNSRESAMYVFKENLLLSVMGTALGLVGGIFLLEFVISKIKIDFVWIIPRLALVSFLLSVVFTLLSAVLVDFVLYFKLEKINMAEALKSVE